MPDADRLAPLDPLVARTLLDAAIEEAEAGRDEGGIPIGSALGTRDGRVVARGRNRRVQSGDPTAHAEVECIRAAGRRRDWKDLVLASTLSPCPMCTGTAVLFAIPTVVIGEHRTYLGAEHWLREEGVELVLMDDPRCIALMEELQRDRPDLWAEDIGD